MDSASTSLSTPTKRQQLERLLFRGSANIDMSQALTSRRNHNIWVVVPHFNPLGLRSTVRNLHICLRSLRAQAVSTLVVEGIAPQRVSAIKDGDATKIIRVGAADIMWQKERFLNLGVAALPKECVGVVLLDADIVFESPDWAFATAHLLEHNAIVQPFSRAVWLTEEQSRHFDQMPMAMSELVKNTAASRFSFAYAARHSAGKSNDGHTGFAWAVRRTVLDKVPLFEHLIVGGFDTVLAAAASESPLLALCERYWPTKLVQELMVWAKAFKRVSLGELAYAPGSVMHLWHGEMVHRDYEGRQEILIEERFDPSLDLVATPGKALTWTRNNPRLQKRI